jgi:hypothetical protein
MRGRLSMISIEDAVKAACDFAEKIYTSEELKQLGTNI